MKRKIVLGAAVVLAIWGIMNIFIGVAWLAGSGKTALTDSPENGALCEVRVTAAREFYVIEHAVFSAIPLGTERFYLAETEKGRAPFLIKANESWYYDNFVDGKAEELYVEGRMRKFRASETKELDSFVSGDGKEYGISGKLYLDTLFRPSAAMKIAGGALLLVGAGLAAFVCLRFGSVSGRPAKLCVAGSSAAALAGIIIMMIGFTAFR